MKSKYFWPEYNYNIIYNYKYNNINIIKYNDKESENIQNSTELT